MNEQHQARWIAVLAATGIGLYLCWLMLRPFIGVLEWATVLVLVFYPIHKRLAEKIKRRKLSALLSCLLVVIIVALPFVFLTAALATELSSVGSNLEKHVFPILNADSSVAGRLTKWLNDRFHIDARTTQILIADQLKGFGAALVGQSIHLVQNVVTGIVKAFFITFTMYYLFRDGDKIVQALPNVLPLRRQQSAAILLRINQVVSASVYGVVSIAILQGILAGVAFWLLGVPSPLLWATVLTFVCMIPIAGSFFVWLPASVYLMFKGHWTGAIALILWGTFVISTVDNFLRPKLIKNQTKLHELFVFFSVLGGISVFGLLGIVLGPVVLAVTLGLLQTFRPIEDGSKQAVAKSIASVDLPKTISVHPKAISAK